MKKLKATAIPSKFLVPQKMIPTEMLKEEQPSNTEVNLLQTNLDLAEDSYGMGISQVLEILKNSSDGNGLNEIIHHEDEGKIVLIYNKKPVEEYLDDTQPEEALEQEEMQEEDELIMIEDQNPLIEGNNDIHDDIIEEDVEEVHLNVSYDKIIAHEDYKVNTLSVYECSNCSFTSDSTDKLKFHTRICVEKILPFQCGMCDEKFELAKQLAEHIKNHRANKTYVASETFNPDIRKRHRKNEPIIIGEIKEPARKLKKVDVKKAACKRCKMIMLESQMPIHMQIHKNSENLKRMCEFCETIYESHALLEMHYEEAHTMEKYCCVFCTQGHSTKKELFNHHKRHGHQDIISYTRQKDSVRTVQIKDAFYYECNLCCEIFLSKVATQNHLLIHRLTLNNTKFYCNQCNKVVADEQHIRNKTCRQIMIIDEAKKLTCDICGMICLTPDETDEHIENAHPIDNTDIEWII